MKKIMYILIILLVPIKVFAYSNEIIPGGSTIGITLNSKGIMVVGFYKVNNKFYKNDLKVGDIITKVNGIEVNTIEDLIKEIESNVIDNKVLLNIKRSDKTYLLDFTMTKVDGKYKTGLYVKDSISGIGTLTYIDPNTKIYGALGHEITESSSGNIIEVKDGNIFRASITGIDRSSNGTAGTKNAKFYSSTIYGNIIKNTNKGIYGLYDKEIDNTTALEVGTINDIKKGTAYIQTVLDKEKIETYEIEIDDINNKETKNIHFIIKSDELLNKAGGIVQGMSGSPIIQNNKIIGAVTHVIVNNPQTGYGILIATMLKEGEQ